MNSPFAAPSEPGYTPTSSSSSTRGPGVVTTKEFACVFPGCTKAFTRAEHLHRHALNHNEGNGSACHRCNAVFKRRDLLERHMARHKEKDDEAGGDGLGKLLTRKRLWRDSTGAIVSKKRPEHEKERKQSSHPRSAPAATLSNQEVRSDTIASSSPQGDLPLSPSSLEHRQASNGSESIDPLLVPRRSQQPSPEKRQVPVATMIDPWPLPEGGAPFQDVEVDSLEFLCNGSWGIDASRADVNPDSVFDNLEVYSHGSSNSPFPTMNSYSRLFRSESWPQDSDNGTNGCLDPKPYDLSSHDIVQINRHQTPAADSPSLRRFPDIRLPPIGQEAFSPGFGATVPNPSSNHGVPAFAEFLAMSQSNSYLREPPVVNSSDTSFPVRALSAGIDQLIRTPPEPRSGPDFSRSNPSKRLRRLPIIGDVARNGILYLFDHAQPKASDGSILSGENPLLSKAALQHFSDLFFRRFNTSYPLFHQPTFDPSAVDPLLLFALLQLGASYSTRDDHVFAVSLHNTMRAQIFGHPSFNPRPCLWVLQTIFLVECFGKFRAGQLQYDMSQLFHNLLIDLLHRSECLFGYTPKYEESGDLEYQWRYKVHTEQRRRLAFLVFNLSTQHALLFSQSPSISPTEFQLDLPWNPLIWEADTAESWATLISTHRQQSYLRSLRCALDVTCQTPHLLNNSSRTIVLHGLISLALDLQGRERTMSGPLTLHAQPWKVFITHAFESWKKDFDAATKTTLTPLPEYQCDDVHKSTAATLSLYHVAYIALYVSLTDLQSYAGTHHILGRFIEPAEHARSLERIKNWAAPGSMDGAIAVSHAALLLRDGITKLHNWDSDDVFHYPWCLYIATLTCWAFLTGVSDNHKFLAGEGVEIVNGEASERDARAEMNALISAITRAKTENLWRIRGRYRVGDLPKVMAKVLGGVRWAVVQEGVVVLRELGKGR